MIEIYNTLIYHPMFNLMVWLYQNAAWHDLGITIIFITIIIKLILHPLSVKSIKAQKSLQELQPKMEELKKKYKGKPQELGQKTMELYKEHKISPASSCVPLLIQMPFLIAVYHVFRAGFKPESLDLVYSFISKPESINPVAFGFLDLSVKSLPLAVLAGLAQFWVSKMLMTKRPPQVKGAKDENMASAMNKQMLYFMPIFTVIIGMGLPGGLTFYWFLTTALTGVQQLYIFKHHYPVEGKVAIPADVKEADTVKEIEENK